MKHFLLATLFCTVCIVAKATPSQNLTVEIGIEDEYRFKRTGLGVILYNNADRDMFDSLRWTYGVTNAGDRSCNSSQITLRYQGKIYRADIEIFDKEADLAYWRIENALLGGVTERREAPRL